MATTTIHRPNPITRAREDNPTRRRKEARTDIWSNLLRQTREAQARSRTNALQNRELLICGGSAEDQRSFVQTITRPPPPQPHNRASRDHQRDRRDRGEAVLSNRFAYGYGHVTLFSPPPQGGGLLGNDFEEVARIGLHTIPEPHAAYEETLRRLLKVRRKAEAVDGDERDEPQEKTHDGGEVRRPSVVLLLSWRQPWKFLDLLRRWLQLLARALLESEDAPKEPIEVLKEHGLSVTVVVQHVEFQEQLERDNYREESFDYISQCLRTCLLPFSAALIYTPSAPPAPPNALTAPLSEVQKVTYTALGLDLGALSPASARLAGGSRKEEVLPKHNVVDRMAVVVPHGWDSVGKIRVLSETFSPEALLDGWNSDINTAVSQPDEPDYTASGEDNQRESKTNEVAAEEFNGGGEQYMYETAGSHSPIDPLPHDDIPMSPSKQKLSAISSFEQNVQDPQAHKAPQPPRLEVTTKPEQTFLAEMRTQLQMLEERDRERQRLEPGSIATASTTGGGRGMAMPSGESSGALNMLGDVHFNVGGVNFNAATAEAAIERLRRPTQPESPRTGTPRPPKREERESGRETPRTSELDTDKLEEYFHSLMKRGGGTSSGQSTPSKPAAGR